MFSVIPLPYKIAAIVFIIISAFGFGYVKGNARAEAEIATFAAEQNAKVAELERKNAEISNTVVTKYVDKVRVVKEREVVYVNTATNYVPGQFDLSNGWLFLHDASVKGLDADSTRASDATASGIKDNQALGVVIGNYSTCRQNAEQLIQLQDWIRKTQTEMDNGE